MKEIQGKKAIITGASKGIGRAISKTLASEGIDIFITARDEERLRDLEAELSGSGSRVGYQAADLTVESEVNNLFSAAIDFLGGVDILVNNAGIGIKGNVTNIEIADWEKMYRLNLKAAFMLSRLAAREMIKNRFGYIINIGSGASQTPIAGFAGYCAAKHGLLGFSESLALELREFDIKVSIILPGSTATHFGGGDPESKIAAKPGMLRPEDIADSVLYILKQRDNAWTSVMNLRPLNLNRNTLK
jgi:3-oxoacyl-[acyl-carrier protein] reductase